MHKIAVGCPLLGVVILGNIMSPAQYLVWASRMLFRRERSQFCVVARPFLSLSVNPISTAVPSPWWPQLSSIPRPCVALLFLFLSERPTWARTPGSPWSKTPCLPVSFLNICSRLAFSPIPSEHLVVELGSSFTLRKSRDHRGVRGSRPRLPTSFPQHRKSQTRDLSSPHEHNLLSYSSVRSSLK